jgi:hypothetical protein
LARALVNPCLGCEPKVRVATMETFEIETIVSIIIIAKGVIKKCGGVL